MSEIEVIQATWRKLRSGEWGAEIREGRGSGFDDVTGEVVEVSRWKGGGVARCRLVKRVSPRRGRLNPLYAVEKIERDEEEDDGC